MIKKNCKQFVWGKFAYLTIVYGTKTSVDSGENPSLYPSHMGDPMALYANAAGARVQT